MKERICHFEMVSQETQFPPLIQFSHSTGLFKLAAVGFSTLNNQWFLEGGWWAQRDSNPRPSDYESPALTAELWALLSKGFAFIDRQPLCADDKQP